MKKYIYSFLVLIVFSCKSDSELSIERGIYFYDWGKYDEAIIEFNKSKFYQLNKNNQSYDDLKLLAQIYYNLAITYAKIDMYDLAYNEAQRAFTLIPKKEYQELLDLILEQKSSN